MSKFREANEKIVCLLLCVGALAACTRSESPAESATPLVEMEHYSPNAVYVNEASLSIQGSADAYEDTATVVERKHTFSNGEVYAYATLGKEVRSGDMVLGTVAELEEEINEYEEHLAAKGSDNLSTQAAVLGDYCTSRFIFCFATGGKWPNKIVYYEPLNNNIGWFDAGQRRQIINAINYLSANTELDFRQRNTGDRILFTNNSGGGCTSYVGRTGGRQNVNLERNFTCFGIVNASGFDGSILHELLHAVGLIHEHQRSDRNTFVRVNSNDSNYAPTYDTETYTPYDFGSIMHYPLDSRIQRINRSQNYPDNQVGQRDRMSGQDRTAVNVHY